MQKIDFLQLHNYLILIASAWGFNGQSALTPSKIVFQVYIVTMVPEKENFF